MTARIAPLVAAAALAAACAAPVADPGLDRVRVSYVPFVRFAPRFVGDELGLFREQGIELELIMLPSTRGAIAALVSGELDVAGAFTSAGVFNAIGRGAEIRIVASRWATGSGGCWPSGVLVRTGVLDRPEGLRGLRTSVRRGTVEEFYIDHLLAAEGLSLADLRVTTVPSAAKPGAFAAGTLDIAYTGEPHFTLVQRSGAARVWRTTDEIVPGFEDAFFLFGPRLLSGDPDLGRRFMVAYLRSVARWNAGPDPRLLEIVSDATGIELEVLGPMCWFQFSRDGVFPVESALEFQRWAVARGYQDGVVPVEEFWDASFVEHAGSVLGLR